MTAVDGPVGRLGAGLWRTVALLPGVSTPLTATVGAGVLASGLLPVAFTVVTGVVVGAVPAAVADGLDSPAGRRLLALVALAGLLFVLRQSLAVVVEAAAEALGRRLNGVLRERVMRAALRPAGIAHLEDADLLDTIGLARNVVPGQFQPGAAVIGLAMSTGPKIAALASAVIVARWSWPLALGLVVASVVAYVLVTGVFFQMVALWVGRRGDLRRAVYYRDLALTAPAAKELRIFGLRRWLHDRFTGAWLEGMDAVWRDRRQGRTVVGLALALHGLAMFAGLALVARAGIRGELTLTETAVLLGAVEGALSLSIGSYDLNAAYGAAAVPALLDLERTVAEPRFAATGDGAAAGMPEQAIRFEDVSFSYPGSERPVLDRLDLDIPAGRSLAIVGLNGAGKTTLVKLLARLYEPVDGRITIDGAPLAGIAPDAWRRQLAVLFQDYLRYELPAFDNVGFGALELRRDRTALERAAARAGALDVVDRTPGAWDAVLSRTVTGGADLSGGEWQRIALARALLAVENGARVLVLDEPTANLDVRAEAALYDRFLDLTAGLTTVLISHRFSTVRRAEHIVVLEHGRIVEEGAHDELLAAGGRYASMFRMQAARFADEGGPGPALPERDLTGA
jgi:ATP-binding cassette subfamily B protein